MIEVAQLRAARALIEWSQDRLADASGVSKPTIARLELGSGAIGGYAGTRDKLRAALEAGGVIFVEENGEGPGVRLRKQGAGERLALVADLDEAGDRATTAATERTVEKHAGDHPKPSGPATDVIERMEAEIAADRRKPGRKL